MKKLERLGVALFQNFSGSTLTVHQMRFLGGGFNTQVDNCTYNGDHCGSGSENSATCNDGSMDDAGGSSSTDALAPKKQK